MPENITKHFYNSKAWIKCRESYIAYRRGVDGGMCEFCHEALGQEVHHREKLTAQNINDPDVTLNFDNLAFLCKSCHFNEHHHKMVANPILGEIFFTPVGDPYQIPPLN